MRSGADLRDIELGPEKEGVIVAHYGAQADVVEDLIPEAQSQRCFLRANLDDVVVGDRVVWRDSNEAGVIVATQPRVTELGRPDKNGNLRPVAANIDRMILVIAPEPMAHANLIDRYLVAAEHQGIFPLLVINKIDLMNDSCRDAMRDLLATYSDLGYPILEVSTKFHRGIDELCQKIAEHTAIFVGQSGVGKSSLINRILPAAEAEVGDLSQSTIKGTHTTTTARMYFLPSGGRLIDSPGIREFGLWHLDPERVAQGFVEFRPYLGACRFRNCQHKREPGCALVQAVDEGRIKSCRLESYFRIIQDAADG